MHIWSTFGHTLRVLLCWPCEEKVKLVQMGWKPPSEENSKASYYSIQCIQTRFELRPLEIPNRIRLFPTRPVTGVYQCERRALPCTQLLSALLPVLPNEVTLWRTWKGDAPEPNLSLGPRTLTSSAMHSACQPKIVLHPCQVLLLSDYLLCKIPWQSSWYHYLVGMELPALIGFFSQRI